MRALKAPSRFRRNLQVFAGYESMWQLGWGLPRIDVQDLRRLFVESKTILQNPRCVVCTEVSNASNTGGKQDNLHRRPPCIRHISGDRRTHMNA